MAAQWFGFHDQESGIHSYAWCIGDQPKLCNLSPYQIVHTATDFVTSNLSLPILTPIYICINATNKAGLWSVKSSSPVYVDTSPPVVLKRPAVVQTLRMQIQKETHYDPSVLAMEWGFEDLESPLMRHIVSVETHHDGVVPVDALELYDEQSIVVSLKDNATLSDGDTYYGRVTACNAAGLCTSSTTKEPILVDSSPPFLGGFQEPLLWFLHGSELFLNLSWSGFEDEHSNITRYFITVGKTFSDDSLSNGTVVILHNDLINAGMQSTSIPLTKVIPVGQSIILSIWAENRAGLNSSIGRITVWLLSSAPDQSHGILDVEKHSCDIHYCNYDCTCAVMNKKCLVDVPLKQCLANDSSTNTPILHVYDGFEVKNHDISISTKCLSGHWTVNPQVIAPRILRYEWSIGFTNSTGGDGIFDTVNEKHWFDVGLNTHFLYCLPGRRKLTFKRHYSVYVRAWHSFNTYTEMTSDGVLIDITPPAQRRGKRVIDCLNCFEDDIRFSNNLTTLGASWKDFFVERQSGIDHFEVYIGTVPGGIFRFLSVPYVLKLENKYPTKYVHILVVYSMCKSVFSYQIFGNC